MFAKKNNSSSMVFFSIVFFAFGFFYIMIAQNFKTTPYIEWTKSEYVSGYQIQIQNQSGLRVVDKKVTQNKYPISGLKDGKYRMRVGALSPFSKPVVWTGWSDLIIKTKPKVVKKIDPPETKKPDPMENIPESSPCLTSDIPVEVIKECKEDYIVLDLTTKEKKSIYNVYTLGGNNRSARIQIIRYYRDQCKDADSAVSDKISSLLNSKDSRINSDERAEANKTLEVIKNCR